LVTLGRVAQNVFGMIIGSAAQDTSVFKTATKFKVGQLGAPVDDNHIFGFNVSVRYSASVQPLYRLCNAVQCVCNETVCKGTAESLEKVTRTPSHGYGIYSCKYFYILIWFE